MNRFNYSSYGRMTTGFDNSIDRSLYGHPSNPEYQEECQCSEIIDYFDSWFHSNEVRGDIENPKNTSMDELFEHFIKRQNDGNKI